MNQSETDIALVEKYFDAELSESEMQHFTLRLESDENFKSLVEQEKALIAAIRYQGYHDNLEYLSTLENNLQRQTPLKLKPTIKRWYYYAAAATVALIIMVKVFINPFSESPDQLFQAYFTPYPNLFEPGVRGDAPADAKRHEAFAAYEQGDYQKAATLFSELLSVKREPGILLLLGNSNLILGNVDEAKKNFITLNKDFDELDMQSKWFLSLCYLKSGDVDQARAILEELGNTEISYANKAKELLEKVN